MRKASGVVAAAIVIGLMTSRPVAQGGVASAPVQSKPSETVTAENAAAVIERLDRRIRVERDGRAEVMTRVTVSVREASAVQALGHVYLFYLPSSESMELISMTVRKPDGREVKVDVAALKELPPTESGAFDGPTFSDMRVKQIAVPALGIGDTLSYESQSRQHTPLSPGHFWSEASFNRSAIVLDESFELDWAADLRLTVRVGDDVTEQHDVVAEKGRHRRRWTHSQREITEADRTAMSKLIEALGEGKGPMPDIQVSTFATWAAVADWYRGLSRSAEAVSPAIREKARELTETAATPEARLAALHKFVAQDVRYVSLAFGNGRYQPRGADLVLSSQYGDCKDKHALLASLASAVGFTVEPVLINTTRRLDDMFPSPSQFNHVISLVSGQGLATTWIDGTAAVSRPGVLFQVLRGKKGLKAGEPVDFVDTPSTAGPERTTVTTTGTYESDGKYRATVRREFQGDSEMLMRQMMAASDQQSRRRVAQQTASDDDGYGKNAKVVAVTTAEPLNLDQPFWWQDKVEVTYGSPVRAEAYTFWIPGAEFDLPDADDDVSEPVDLGGLTTFDAVTRLELPPGLSITPPVPVSISNEFAMYTSRYGVEKGAERNVLTIERRLTTKVETVAASDLGAYRAFQRAADGDRRQMFAVAAATADAVRASAPKRSADLEGYDALGRGDLDAAVRLLRQAVAENPQHKSAWNNLGLYARR